MCLTIWFTKRPQACVFTRDGRFEHLILVVAYLSGRWTMQMLLLPVANVEDMNFS